MPLSSPLRRPTREDVIRARTLAAQKAGAAHSFVKRRKTFFEFWIVRVVVAVACFVIFSMGSVFMWIAIQPIPSIQSFDERKVTNSTIIYDRTGKVMLYNLGQDIERQVVNKDVISPLAKQAFVAIEDKNFYEHRGIVVHSTIRGIVFTVLSKIGVPVDGSGGSTITQQVVKNTLLTNEYRYTRKLKEWFLAVKLEKRYSKDDILGIYLNEIPFGGNLYGIEAASKAFFGVSSHDITLAQAAYLAAIPNAPTLYSPYGKHVDKLEARKNLVLARMRESGFINDTELARARSEKVEFLPRSDSHSKAIHFVEYVRQELERRYGANVIDSGGLRVISSLDWRLQEQAEKIVAARALENESAWNASNQALVGINPQTGEVLAMVGSRNYSDPAIDGKFNVATALRQPGSSFKPFIYAKAFEQGYTDQTVIFDVPIQFSTTCPADNFTTTPDARCYSPDNYDGKFLGPISLRNALAQSRNIPAVEMMYLVGTNEAIRFARTLGITSLSDPSRYGLTLVLGGGEVSLLDMTSAYGVFANDGIKVEPTAINRIEDAEGKVLYEARPTGSRVMSADAARRLNSVLSDNVARTPLFGSSSSLYFGADRPVAAKTGTTNNNKDAWLIGYTPNIVIGVWSGNNDNTPMKKGSIISAPAWRDTMNVALQLYGYTPFLAPQSIPLSTKPVLRGMWWGNESVLIDTISGKRATEYTPNETLREIVIPEPHSILHWVTRGNPNGPVPVTPSSDSQYERWEAAVRRWVTNNPGSVPAAQAIPSGNDDVHTPAHQPRVAITSTTVSPTETGDSLTVNFTVNDNDIRTIRVIIDGSVITELPAGSTTTTVSIPGDSYSAGEFTVAIEAIDTVWNRGGAEKRITL